MKHTWRWFGPHDVVELDEIRQAGASGVVTALSHIPNGEVWTVPDILTRKELIARKSGTRSTGLSWDVVESLPVSENIKKQDHNWRSHLENYKQSLENLSKCGIETVCYNFMPILDWTRTDLAWPLANGANCMRFDYTDFAVFDCFILARAGASEDYPADLIEEAQKRFSQMSETAKKSLSNNIVSGLPGANQNLALEDVAELLEGYSHINEDVLRGHFFDFLEAVVPTAEKCGVRLCCHPDDPPFPLLGLPRIMSCEKDYTVMVEAVDSPSNGITLCSGSLGAHVDNDLPGMMERLGSKVHFLHLRNVVLEDNTTPGSFHEGEHLCGSADMVALVAAIIKEEHRRKTAGREDHQIPMRPDHGQNILDDNKRASQPGYPAIGRLKGLAELRGVELALSQSLQMS